MPLSAVAPGRLGFAWSMSGIANALLQPRSREGIRSPAAKDPDQIEKSLTYFVIRPTTTFTWVAPRCLAESTRDHVADGNDDIWRQKAGDFFVTPILCLSPCLSIGREIFSVLSNCNWDVSRAAARESLLGFFEMRRMPKVQCLAENVFLAFYTFN